MLPNLTGLRLAPTAVLVDGVVAASAPEAVPAPAPAAPAAKRPHTDAPPSGPVDDVLSNDQMVALVLSMVASRDVRKADACRAAAKMCSVNRTTATVCAYDPWVWRAWSKTIFADPDADRWERLLGQGLIYRTFYDDGKPPSESFGTMCTRSAIADVTSKLFVLEMLERAIDEMYDTAVESGELDEDDGDKSTDDEKDDMAVESGEHDEDDGDKSTDDEKDDMAGDHYHIGEFKTVRKEVAAQLNESRLRPLFDREVAGRPAFRAFFDAALRRVISYYMRHGVTWASKDDFLKLVTSAGDMLGTYIVCLTELQEKHRAAQQELDITPHEIPVAAGDYSHEQAEDFERKVLEHLKTTHSDASSTEMENLLAMAKGISNIKTTMEGDVYDSDELVVTTSDLIYMRDLQRRMAVAVNHLLPTDKSPLDEVSLKGIRDIDDSDRYLYKRLIDYKFDGRGNKNAELALMGFSYDWLKDWEPDEPAAAVA